MNVICFCYMCDLPPNTQTCCRSLSYLVKKKGGLLQVTGEVLLPSHASDQGATVNLKI